MEFSTTQVFTLEIKNLEALSPNSTLVHQIKWKTHQVKERLCENESSTSKGHLYIVSLQVSVVLYIFWCFSTTGQPKWLQG